MTPNHRFSTVARFIAVHNVLRIILISVLQCFMKCYLENVGAITADNTIEMKQATVHFATNEDLITGCRKELSEIGIMKIIIYLN